MRPYEHYLIAEELLKDLQQPNSPDARVQITAEAQVHATLALVREGEPLPEVDYNTVVTGSVGGHLHHTYNPKCPPGCYGQYEDCVYKKE